MTECERLIEACVLDPNFLQEETRCDYHVDTKMKKLWALQIDIMKQIETICNKHHITCFLIGGGCIGAVRHQGCIPWDDDIDVALKREDYNLFIEKAQEELQAPYFLQTPVTDPSFYRPFIVMRNSNGTCIAKGDQKLDCNNGICIHVFPLDGYEDNWECNFFRKVSRIKDIVAVTSYNAFSASNHKILRKIMRFARILVFPLGIRHYYTAFNKKCTKLSMKYRKRIGIQYTHFDSKMNHWIWDANCFDSAMTVPFEYTTLPIPKAYHEVLSATYGDYMKFPPVEKRGNKHLFEIEPDIPYQEYCAKKYGVKYKK